MAHNNSSGQIDYTLKCFPVCVTDLTQRDIHIILERSKWYSADMSEGNKEDKYGSLTVTIDRFSQFSTARAKLFLLCLAKSERLKVAPVLQKTPFYNFHRDDTYNIYLSRVPRTIRTRELENLFPGAQRIHVPVNSTGVNHGFAIVMFQSYENYERYLNTCQIALGGTMHGLRLHFENRNAAETGVAQEMHPNESKMPTPRSSWTNESRPSMSNIPIPKSFNPSLPSTSRLYTDDDRPASTSNRGGQRMELFTVNNLPLHISEAKLKEMFPRALSVVIKVDRDGKRSGIIQVTSKQDAYNMVRESKEKKSASAAQVAPKDTEAPSKTPVMLKGKTESRIDISEDEDDDFDPGTDPKQLVITGLNKVDGTLFKRIFPGAIECTVPIYKKTGKLKNFGFVRFASARIANREMNRMQGKVINKKPWIIKQYMSKTVGVMDTDGEENTTTAEPDKVSKLTTETQNKLSEVIAGVKKIISDRENEVGRMPTEGATESGKKSIDEVIRNYLSSMKVIDKENDASKMPAEDVMKSSKKTLDDVVRDYMSSMKVIGHAKKKPEKESTPNTLSTSKQGAMPVSSSIPTGVAPPFLSMSSSMDIVAPQSIGLPPNSMGGSQGSLSLPPGAMGMPNTSMGAPPEWGVSVPIGLPVGAMAGQPGPIRGQQDFMARHGPIRGPPDFMAQPGPVRRPPDFMIRHGPVRGPPDFMTRPGPVRGPPGFMVRPGPMMGPRDPMANDGLLGEPPRFRPGPMGEPIPFIPGPGGMRPFGNGPRPLGSGPFDQSMPGPRGPTPLMEHNIQPAPFNQSTNSNPVFDVPPPAIPIGLHLANANQGMNQNTAPFNTSQAPVASASTIGLPAAKSVTTKRGKKALKKQATNQNPAPSITSRSSVAVTSTNNTTAAGAVAFQIRKRPSLFDSFVPVVLPESTIPSKSTIEGKPVKDTIEGKPVKETREGNPVKETREGKPVKETREEKRVTNENSNTSKQISKKEKSPVPRTSDRSRRSPVERDRSKRRRSRSRDRSSARERRRSRSRDRPRSRERRRQRSLSRDRRRRLSSERRNRRNKFSRKVSPRRHVRRGGATITISSDEEQNSNDNWLSPATDDDLHGASLVDIFPSEELPFTSVDNIDNSENWLSLLEKNDSGNADRFENEFMDDENVDDIAEEEERRHQNMLLQQSIDRSQSLMRQMEEVSSAMAQFDSMSQAMQVNPNPKRRWSKMKKGAMSKKGAMGKKGTRKKNRR